MKSLKNFYDWLPKTIQFFIEKLGNDNYISKDKLTYSHDSLTIKIPETFCLDKEYEQSLKFINTLVQTVLLNRHKSLIIDYSNCTYIGLNAQITLDALLLDVTDFLKRVNKYSGFKTRIKNIRGENILNKDIQKVLFSIGSPAVIGSQRVKFPDIIPYHLCIHDKDSDDEKNIEQKDIDTTTLVQHIIDSLKNLNKTLSQESIQEFSTVIGEILINAEEHSTLNKRYSTGYFQKFDDELNDKKSDRYGVYHLSILNFGESIYSKFKSLDCKNVKVVQKMKELSDKYTNFNFFSKKFSEESLWTLYALQEGVTSIPTEEYFQRGNGSIQFIESFFNLRSTKGQDNISRMNIISGTTNIIFDGKYQIKKIKIGSDDFKVMTFNNSGKIEDKPDTNYIKQETVVFPGTIITAKILITQDDIYEDS